MAHRACSTHLHTHCAIKGFVSQEQILKNLKSSFTNSKDIIHLDEKRNVFLYDWDVKYIFAWFQGRFFCMLLTIVWTLNVKFISTVYPLEMGEEEEICSP